MRAAALLLLVTLAGPSLAAVVCNLDCVAHLGAAAEEGCHHHDAGKTRLSGDGTAMCHAAEETVAVVAAIMKSLDAPTPLPTPAAWSRSPLFIAPSASDVPGATGLRSPITQLRI